MSNIEIARRIIANFIAKHPSRIPMDFIIGNFSIYQTSCFEWDMSPEGFNFWNDLYINKFMEKDSLVKQFVLKYYFMEGSKFIDLDKMC